MQPVPGGSLSLGQFYGDPQLVTMANGFDVRLQNATGREEDVQTHTHLDAHFVLVISGTYISSAHGVSARVGAPALIFNPPGTTHRDRFVNGIGSFLSVSMAGPTYCDLASAISVADYASLTESKRALTTAFEIARGIRGSGDASCLEASAWELLACIEQIRHPVTRPPPWALTAYEVIMDQATDARLEVRHVARKIDVHPVHLARVFRDCWGCSPGELIRWRRLDRAAELLRRPGLSGAEIAAEVGFVDQSHLTRAFRATYGVSPGEYRKHRLHRYKPGWPPSG